MNQSRMRITTIGLLSMFVLTIGAGFVMYTRPSVSPEKSKAVVATSNSLCDVQADTPIVGASLSWPIAKQDETYLDWINSAYENDATWKNTLKPKIVNDFQYYITSLNLNTPEKRHATNISIQLPINSIKVFHSAGDRGPAIVRRLFEVSKQLDIPISFKLLYSHWWGVDRGVNGEYFPNIDQAWDDRKHPTDWYENVEWWGWSKDYVWSKPSDNEGRVDTLWRDWGKTFAIHFPHPNYNATKYRETYQALAVPIIAEIVNQYTILKTQCKDYLFSYLVTDSEVTMGSNWEMVKNIDGVSTFGVKSYIEKKCPTDVLNCLPPKPTDVTREVWIKQKSDEYYRPDDFALNNISTVQDYLRFTAQIAITNGLPKNKVITHTVISQKIRTHNGNNSVFVSDGALNEHNNNPGFSIYFNGMTQADIDNLYTRLIWMKVNRSSPYINVVEYFDNRPQAEASKNMQDLLTRSEIPKVKIVNIQNWDNVRPDAVTRGDYFATTWPNVVNLSTVQKENVQTYALPYSGNLIERTDLNKSRRVDIKDFLLFRIDYRESSLRSDFDLSNKIAIQDFLLFRNTFGKSY